MKNEIILITGTSSGLGRALAVTAGKLSATVVMISRNYAASKKTAEYIESKGGRCFYYIFDLEKIEAIPRLVDKISKDVGSPPTILFNNVGYQVAGFVQGTPIETYSKNFRVNTLAPLALIQSCLPHMLKNRRGVIANVMSSITYHAFPGVSSLCVTKNALKALHQSLKIELSRTPIRTVLVMPGGVNSEYWANTVIGDEKIDYKRPTKEFLNRHLRPPEVVAATILSQIMSGKETIDLSSFKDKVGYHLAYWKPSLLEKIIYSKNRSMIDNYPDNKDS